MDEHNTQALTENTDVNGANTLFCIAYMSEYVGNVFESDLDDILESANKHNSSNAVTGLLLADNNIFMQVLEGEEADVLACYAMIEKDPRHKNIKCLRNEIISIRTFPDWHMAYVPMDGLGNFQRDSFIHLRDLVISKKVDALFKDPQTSFLVRNFFSTVAVPAVTA